MARYSIRSALAVLAAAAATAITVVTAAGATPAAASDGGWTGVWATALTPQGPFVGLNTFDDQSVRMIVQTTSVGGHGLRIRLSNRHGASDLAIGAATVGRPAAESTPDLVPWSVRELSFGGSASVTIPAGGEVYSDPVGLWAPPLSQLAVTLYLPEPTGPVPVHLIGKQTTYVYDGDHTGKPTGDGHTATTTHFHILAGVEVRNPVAGGTVVVLGASITDSFGATDDANTRVPDFLARRLVNETSPIGRPGVLNMSLSGNAIGHDGSEIGQPEFGPSGLNRLDEHVFDQPGVRTVIVDLGLIDQFQHDDPPEVMIEGLRRIAAELHRHGIRVLFATLTPAGARADPPGWTPEQEATRQAVNAYIRTTGDADGVVDADRAVRDPHDPTRVAARFATEDGVHTNDLGNWAWARAVPLRLL